MASAYTETGYCRIIDLGAVSSTSTDLDELCEMVSWDEEARVVLLCLNPDVNTLLKDKTPLEGLAFVNSLAKIKLPVIAAIQGNAIGLALELALACDIRIGSASACFGLDQIQKGQIPSNGGTQRLPRLIGKAKAMHMILTGDLIDSAEACRIGLIHKAVEPESVVGVAAQMAQDMATKSPLSLSYVKEALYSGADLTLDQGLKLELDLYLHLFTTFDRTEGINAFREKRKPQFKGN